MFIMRNAVRSILRTPMKSILSVLLCAAITLLLSLYMGNLEENRQILHRLPEVMDVAAYVSNLNGSITKALQISTDKLDAVTQSEYVENPYMSVRIVAGFGEFPDSERVEHLKLYGAGINDYGTIAGMTEDEVNMLSGVTPDFLKSNKRQCLIIDEFLRANGLQVGDTVTLSIYYYWYYQSYDLRIGFLETEEYEIVGAIKTGLVEEDNVYVILVPFQTIRDSYERQDIRFFADSLEFTVKNPMELNEFKKQMEEIGFAQVSPTADTTITGNALTVKDDMFIRSVEQAQNNIDMMEGFLPFILAIVIFAGFLSSYLLTQSRRQEYALMRSVGCGRARCFAVFLTGYFLLALSGCLCGALVAGLFANVRWIFCLQMVGVFLACYLLGTVVSLLLMARISVMAVLTRND